MEVALPHLLPRYEVVATSSVEGVGWFVHIKTLILIIDIEIKKHPMPKQG